MAEDGMLLNFSVADDNVRLPTSNTTKFKGGSWRERMRLKKGVKGNRNGPASQSGGGNQQAYLRATRNKADTATGDFNDPRPTKRRRENGEFVPLGTGAGSRQPNADGTARKSGPQREVISSLFSYNPVPKAVEQPTVDETNEPVKPSNAPLPDGIDTFTSLGLSTTVAAHLLTKMALKTPTAIQKAAVSQLLKEDSDAFIQSETGSGKTLAYLLPIVQRIMSLTQQSQATQETTDKSALHRDSGLFAIVLAPTRELCKQISVVLERLLGCAHYIVAGTVLGGEKKKSEKARLRKGLNVLVATPGRLVDHLENTESLDVSFVRFLVLDEGDRLMDLGFEEDITKIVKTLDSKRRKGRHPGLPDRRITILCSATLKMNVQKLGDISLKDAVLIKGDGEDSDTDVEKEDGKQSAFLAPAQLKQSYIVTAAKLRLVTLTALLRRTFARKGSVMKAIVFVSCADSVEFLFKTLTREVQNTETKEDEGDKGETSAASPKALPESLTDAVAPSPLLSNTSNPLTIYKLHGSLPQATRTAIVKNFAGASTPSLLIATDVASRGLDLPNLDLVIEYDPAFSTDEHLHRIGRTARLGRDGRATIFLLPGKEENYVQILQQSFKKDVASSSNVTSQGANDVLRKGFTPATGVVSTSNKEWETKATNFQLDTERWILADAKVKDLARRAFQSHIRAYATHVASERKYFDIKNLHLGHLAKSFGLRDPPGRVNVAGMRGSTTSNTTGNNPTKSDAGKSKTNNQSRRPYGAVVADAAEGARDMALARAAKADIDETKDADEAAQKMRYMVRNRKKMMGAGADEFNIA